jgi:hypothetical protein
MDVRLVSMSVRRKLQKLNYEELLILYGILKRLHAQLCTVLLHLGF